MKSLHYLLAALILLPSACAAPSQSVLTATPALRSLTPQPKEFLYVANSSGSITEYAPGRSTVLRSITIAGPGSMGFDSSGYLYVENDGMVNVYAPGSSSPLRTISPPPNMTATHVAVAPSGTIYVGYGTTKGVGYPCAIAAYGPQGTPELHLISVAQIPSKLIVNDDGYLYVGFLNPIDASGSYIAEYTSRLRYLGAGGAKRPGSLAIDGSNNLYYAVDASLSYVSVFTPNSLKTLYVIGANPIASVVYPTALAIAQSGDLYVANDPLEGPSS